MAENNILSTAYWGNDDAESCISLTAKQWGKILAGGSHTQSAESWYEGEKGEVTWRFLDRLVTIEGEDGRQCLIDQPLSELCVNS